MSATTTGHLDKEALVVTYCDGIRCNGSTKGALNMVQLGFRVKELIGGIDCWAGSRTVIRKNIPVISILTYQKYHNIVAIDNRQ